jgi:hypothetical protein
MNGTPPVPRDQGCIGVSAPMHPVFISNVYVELLFNSLVCSRKSLRLQIHRDGFAPQSCLCFSGSRHQRVKAYPLFEGWGKVDSLADAFSREALGPGLILYSVHIHLLSVWQVRPSG